MRLVHLKTSIARKWNGAGSVSTIFRGMAVLASGSVAGKVIGLVTAPVITRIYLPEHMGVLSVFMALLAIVVPFVDLLYSLSIPLPKNDGSALNLAAICGGITVVTSTLVFFLLWFFAAPVLSLLSMEQLLPYWWLFPVALASTGFYGLLSQWAVREKAFQPLSKTAVWQAGIGAMVKIGLGFLGFKPLGLLVGQVFNQAGGISSLLRILKRKLRGSYRHITIKRMIFLLRHYAEFPKYRLPSTLLLVVSKQAPLLFFAWQFGAEITGNLGLALNVIVLPLSLLGQTTGYAFYAEIARIGRRNPEKIQAITRSITKKLFLLSIPPSLILFFLGPWLFQLFFGNNWREAGVFASILTLYSIAQFVYTPVANGVLNVFEKQLTVLKINTSRVVLIGCVFIVSKLIDLQPYWTLYLYSIALTAQYIIATVIVFNIINNAKKLAES